MIKENIEQWRAVKGFEGYAVSNLGRVKSVERTIMRKNGIKQHIRERILKPANKDGYLRVVFYKNGVTKSLLVHRLVAEAFIPNPCPEKYDIVNHKDDSYEGRCNNSVENLEWCDTAYNNAYGHRGEHISKTNTNGKCSKTVYQYTKNYELVKEWPSTCEVERQTGFYNNNVSKCCRGKLKTAYNYIWSYTRL